MGCNDLYPILWMASCWGLREAHQGGLGHSKDELTDG